MSWVGVEPSVFFFGAPQDAEGLEISSEITHYPSFYI